MTRSSNQPLVIGIETSCDELGVAFVRGHELLSDVVASSVAEHARFGGVVPEVASRAHVESLQATLEAARVEAEVAWSDVDAVAVTAGPGLVGALVVGWRDDLDDAVARASVTTAYLASYVFVEIYNEGEFVVLPILRFVAGWPDRIANWFTDPLRGGVPLEIIFLGLVAWIVWRRVDRYRPQHAARLARTS